MYRVLLVDDEPLILAAMKTIIPWNEKGFVVDGEAADGRSALALLENRPFDLVVSDVKMPDMSGIQMLQAMHRSGMETKVVFLSAYSDFIYTQEAIKLGAFDYLLKPINEDELIEVLGRFVQVRPKSRELDFDFLRNNLFQSYASGFGDIIAQAPHVYDHGLRPGLAVYQAAELLYPVGDADVNVAQSIGKTAIAGVEAVFNQSGIFYAVFENPLWNNRLFVVIGHTEALPDMQQMVQVICQGMLTCGDCVLLAGIGLPQTCFEDIEKSCWQASAALDQCAINDGNCVTVYKMPESGGVMPENVAAREQMFLTSLELCNADEIHQNIRGLFAVLSGQKQITHRQVYRFCCHLLILTERILAKYEISFETILSRNTSAFDYVASHSSLPVLERWFTKTIDCVMEEIEVRRQSNVLNAVDEVITYINAHLREEMTLTHLAIMFHINKSYLSFLFKKRTGMTFIEYVTKLRMELAAELLRTQDVKIYEIARLFSYVDARYFSKLFSRVYGMSPADYRKKHRASP